MITRFFHADRGRMAAFYFIIAMVVYWVSYWTPPFWFLAFVMFFPLHAGVRYALSGSGRASFSWGVFLGVLFLVVGLPPLLVIEPVHFGTRIALSGMFVGEVALFFAIASIIYGTAFGILFLCMRPFFRRIGPLPFVLIAWPLGWIAIESILRMVTFGFDWWLVGIPLIAAGPFRELSSFGGVLFLSFIVALSGGILYALVLLRPFTKYGVFLTGSACAVLAVFVAYGALAHASVRTAYPDALPSIAILQPNVKFPERFPVEVDENYGPLIAEALARNPDVLVFPAQIRPVVTLDMELSKEFWERTLGRSLTDHDVTVVFYMPVRTGDGLYQTMFAVRRGEVIGRYRKELLFPVSDYLPRGFYSVLFRNPPGYSITPYTPMAGEKNGVLTPDGVLGAAICNEPFSPHINERIADTGAPILIVSGSDRPFLTDYIFNGTFRMARLRASETHTWVLRAYKTGISAVIAPNGEVLYKLGRDERGIIFFGGDADGVIKL